MIFVTVGTNEAPFDRLLEALERLPAGEELVVQHGASTVRPARATCVDFLPFDVLVEHVRRARAVVTHAGVGSIMVALANGKRPVVVPRRHSLGEAVDDHQVVFARRLEQAGLVTAVEDAGRLAEALATLPEAPAARPEPGSSLAEELRAYLRERVGAAASGPRR